MRTKFSITLIRSLKNIIKDLTNTYQETNKSTYLLQCDIR
jgi:hypothetical protein